LLSRAVTQQTDQASLTSVIPVYKNNGAIIIWLDETEGGDDASHTLEEIVISPLAKGDAHTNHILYTHSSDLLTTEELFGLGCLDNSCGANDLSDLFKPGTIPAAVPEPSTRAIMLLGFVGLGLALGNHDAVLRSSEASIV
jgi:hypothetical protein